MDHLVKHDTILWAANRFVLYFVPLPLVIRPLFRCSTAIIVKYYKCLLTIRFDLPQFLNQHVVYQESLCHEEE
jgi:hypothetical protein